ncbi:MAG: glycosyltransferase family 2 protein [Bacteroidota bacterium]|nr:glycosyltransferase family 2 protein [Bacteroidota bacterium]
MVIIDVIIPAHNEEKSIARVVEEIPRDLVREIIVSSNNSNDDTAAVARRAGATVLEEAQMGYGNACLKGIKYINSKDVPPDILVFLDGDLSDYPEEMPALVEPILRDECDLVIGSRALGRREPGSMTPQQLFGNWLATRLMRLFYGVHYTDLGPFRAIRFKSLMDLDMKDRNYGWTIEMQVKAARNKLKSCEVPVSYRRRIGFSKVSGTLKGSVLAGIKILYTLFKYIR